MASSSLIPKNGAITVATIIADYAGFDLTTTQSVESVTPYGNNVNEKRVGSGTAGLAANISAFALAHASNTPLLLPTMGAASGAAAAAGAACVFTLDTGVTETGNFVIQSIRIGHARMRAAVPVAISALSAADITEAWASS
jgi:hypothetical protein